MPQKKDPKIAFIVEEFGFQGLVYEVFAKDVMIGEHMFMEIGNIAARLAKEQESFPTPEMFTRLLGSLSERFYIHEETQDLVLAVDLGGQSHYIFIPSGFWAWSEDARPESASMAG